MAEVTKLRKRNEIPVEDTWALEDLYATDEAWEAELATLAEDQAYLSATFYTVQERVQAPTYQRDP